MPFIERILNYNSLSIIGLEKNTGKTECLNYLLRALARQGVTTAITSVGIDGEPVDLVTATPKPAVWVEDGMYFTTAAPFFLQKQVAAVLCATNDRSTLTSKLVTAQALGRGRVVLSGPASAHELQQWTYAMKDRYGVRMCLIDGALSRMSSAAPAVSEALVMTTGAAVAPSLEQVVRKTRFVYDTLLLPVAAPALQASLRKVEQGVWTVSERGEVRATGVSSALQLQDISLDDNTLYVAGAVTGKLLEMLLKKDRPITLIVRDFTRLFVEPALFYAFLRKGGRIEQLMRPELVAICVNPWSPRGSLPAAALEAAVREAVQVPVYNIRNYDA